ncbi:hypothetical protein ANN_14846 [Periplaneta americana]|uniref:Uncharacterized protein n=1 Tax=Periplaneta americana TaxID=6978 RepID=A0ABQ8SYY4_PERAM|nr:hypothetical protein ANN_14846 [Periplaneta americana]
MVFVLFAFIFISYCSELSFSSSNTSLSTITSANQRVLIVEETPYCKINHYSRPCNMILIKHFLESGVPIIQQLGINRGGSLLAGTRQQCHQYPTAAAIYLYEVPHPPESVSKRRKMESQKIEAKEVRDRIIQETTNRFQSSSYLDATKLLNSEFFDNLLHNFPERELEVAVNSYTILNKRMLKTQLGVLYGRPDFRNIDGAVHLLQYIVSNNLQDPFCEVTKLLNILVTTPMTTAEPERCFSCLKRIKTFLRNTMSQDRLTALAILSIEKSMMSKMEGFNIRDKDTSWTCTGVSDLSHLTQQIKNHEESIAHKNACLDVSVLGKTEIRQQLSSAFRQNIKRQNYYDFVKDIVYSKKPRNNDDLRVKITQAFQQITPLMLQRTWAELHHRYELCRDSTATAVFLCQSSKDRNLVCLRSSTNLPVETSRRRGRGRPKGTWDNEVMEVMHKRELRLKKNDNNKGMCKHYVRSSDRGQWIEDSLQLAMEHFRTGGMNCFRASQAYGIPYRTLKHCLNKNEDKKNVLD